MTSLGELAPARGSRKKGRRVGRGAGSRGRYSGRGMKGQKSRSGGGVRPQFEGGQLPLSRRLARKPGFKNIFRVEYSVVNVNDLNVFEENAFISIPELSRAGLVSSTDKPVKILGDGSIRHALTVKAHRFSKVARGKIEEVGGRTENI